MWASKNNVSSRRRVVGEFRLLSLDGSCWKDGYLLPDILRLFSPHPIIPCTLHKGFSKSGSGIRENWRTNMSSRSWWAGRSVVLDLQNNLGLLGVSGGAQECNGGCGGLPWLWHRVLLSYGGWRHVENIGCFFLSKFLSLSPALTVSGTALWNHRQCQKRPQSSQADDVYPSVHLNIHWGQDLTDL